MSLSDVPELIDRLLTLGGDVARGIARHLTENDELYPSTQAPVSARLQLAKISTAGSLFGVQLEPSNRRGTNSLSLSKGCQSKSPWLRSRAAGAFHAPTLHPSSGACRLGQFLLVRRLDSAISRSMLFAVPASSSSIMTRSRSSPILMLRRSRRCWICLRLLS